MHSAIFHGKVKHCRHQPAKHEFSYSLCMYYLSLHELESITKKFSFISKDKFNLLSFKRKNYLGPLDLDIEQAIKLKISEHGFKYEHNNIFLLTHPSYFGYCYNPVTFYYCYNENGSDLEYILAEINNTPWNERHVYVLACETGETKYKFEFSKQFHISPFMPMSLNYNWFLNHPEQYINIFMQAFNNNGLYFDATLSLARKELTTKGSIIELIKFPFMTQKIIFAIYWQALKLWIKRTPFYSHPRKIND